MKTRQLKRNLKNVWISRKQAAEIFVTDTDELDWISLRVGKTRIRTRRNATHGGVEYRLYEIAQAIGSECQKINDQNLWLKVALWLVSIILAFALLYTSIY